MRVYSRLAGAFRGSQSTSREMYSWIGRESRIEWNHGSSLRPEASDPISPAPVESATHHSGAPSLHFELDRVEGSLQQMDGAVVGVDDELASRPLGIVVSADQKFQGELFEDVIVCGLKFVIAK